MRIFSFGRNTVIVDRPYEGALGAKLYVGVDEPQNILYRAARAYDPRHLALAPVHTRDVSVGTCLRPATEIDYTLPTALLGASIYSQVRTFAGDYENETIYQPRRADSTGGGAEDDSVMGTATIISMQKRDGGALRVLFIYAESINGLQPETFTIEKASGAGTVPIVQVTAISGVRDYTADVTGLTDDVAYTFNLVAHSGAIDTVLIAGAAFTSDGDGPGAITGLSALEY